jgi:hypothetical protein
MYNHEINCMKINHILEMGYCVTQVCNKLGDDVCTILTLTQAGERIG